jgi:hypothetical protein
MYRPAGPSVKLCMMPLSAGCRGWAERRQ